jgi:membrane-bound serine protease (ClpP class)
LPAEALAAAPGAVAVGTEGTAETTLRPVGMVRFGELRVESVAEMGMIEAGTAVTVVESTPLRVVVRARG